MEVKEVTYEEALIVSSAHLKSSEPPKDAWKRNGTAEVSRVESYRYDSTLARQH